MAFVNEYIPEADYEKYDLRRVCGERNLKSLKGHMHSNSWTMDRERNAFIIKIWAHRDSPFYGWAFCWKGEWMFFEMALVDGEAKPDGSFGRFMFHVKEFVVPPVLENYRKEVVDSLREAITACPGSPTFSYVNRSVTVEFIGK